MSRCFSPLLRGLYAITPDDLPDEVLLARVTAALTGGARIVQYRDKRRSPAHRLALAGALKTLCRNFAARLIINDDVHLTLAVDADGVHLGASDGDLLAARHAIGEQRWLGASCYADFSLARAAQAAGADYVAFGAAFASTTKPQAPPVAHALYARCRDELSIPVCAIGGITRHNAQLLVAAGADLLALINGLFAVPDVAACACAIEGLFAEKSDE